MIVQRRQFLTGLAALIVAPAIVRAGSIMPVRSFTPSLPYAEYAGGWWASGSGRWITDDKEINQIWPDSDGVLRIKETECGWMKIHTGKTGRVELLRPMTIHGNLSVDGTGTLDATKCKEIKIL